MIKQSSFPIWNLDTLYSFPSQQKERVSPTAICSENTSHPDPSGQSKFDGIINAGETAY